MLHIFDLKRLKITFLNSERKVNSVLIKLPNMKEFRSLIDIERNELIYKLVLEIGREKGCPRYSRFFQRVNRM